MNFAPIALFVYNRPDHTLRTLEALCRNTGASESALHIFCDGPRFDADRASVDRVAEVVESFAWGGSMSFSRRDQNLGLADNIRTGIDEMLRSHDRVIVLEDDIVTSPGFLTFMNRGLKTYADDERVMNISGYLPTTAGRTKLPTTFFLSLMACWGWATWRRAWRHARWDAAELLEPFRNDPNLADRFDVDATYPYTEHLRRNRDGEIKTWAVRWGASCFLRGGLSLFPNQTLVQNIGLDGTGDNCHDTIENHDSVAMAESIAVDRIEVSESSAGREYYKRFHRFGRDDRIVPRIRRHITPPIRRAAATVPERFKSPFRTIMGRPHPFGLADSQRRRLLTLPRYTETTVELFGRTLRIGDAASFLASHDELFRERIYAFDAGRNDPRIFDVGANVGLATLFFKHRYPSAKITAIESDPTIASMLRENLATFDYDDVEVIEAAAWNADEPLEFNCEGADAGAVHGHTNTAVDANVGNNAGSCDDPKKMVTVSGVRLADRINESIDFLKIDIEGAEARVVPDCASAIRRHVKRIFVEHHDRAGQPQTLPTILQTLTEAGFRYHIRPTGVDSPRPLERVNVEAGFDLQLNVFAIRDDAAVT